MGDRMPRFHKTLLLAGNEITAMAEHIAEGQIEEQLADRVLGGPYQVQFDNMYSIHVWVDNSSPPSINAGLFDHDNNLIESARNLGEELDQDYSFDHGSDTYEATIVRAANTVLLDEEVRVYLENGGNRCVCCGSDDLHSGRLRTDSGIAWARVECCSCGARWKDQYTLTAVSREPDEFEPPSSNVARGDQG